MSHLVLAESSAEFSPCRRYRYALKRVFGEGGTVMFVGLNPSTADETQDDPTIRRCLGFARRWGYGTLVMANLYAWRATHPIDLELLPTEARVGPENDAYLSRLGSEADLVVAAWGARHKLLIGRAAHVMDLLPYDLKVLGLTKDGCPRHPLYVRSDTDPQRWSVA